LFRSKILKAQAVASHAQPNFGFLFLNLTTSYHLKATLKPQNSKFKTTSERKGEGKGD